jgi:predicted RNA binding protein YcfA (HicA-like mRNA interferase family)
MSQPPLNYRRAVKLLRQNGYAVGKQAKHGTKMVNEGEPPIILPRHGARDYGIGLTRSIVKQAGLEAEAWSSRSSFTRKAEASGQRCRNYPDATRQAER